MLKIGVAREILEGETRVAVVPKMIGLLLKPEREVLVESGAGGPAHFSDQEYEAAGARMVPHAQALFAEADVILKVHPPRVNPTFGTHEVDMMKPGATFLGFLAPFSNREVIERMVAKTITSFAMEFVPRIARAQSMDALSSMASVAGYRAALLAAQHLGKLFPLMMTAAGTIPPARVLVLGAGVAGLQAIATARRLGARVEAFDTRPAARQQVESLGAHFVEMELPEETETLNGYAKEMSEEFIRREREIIASRLPHCDAVVSTAQVFGKRAPILLTEDMVRTMHPGSVIVDLAAEQGGNCALTEAGQTVIKQGVTIHGAVNLAATLPTDASVMYSKNITTFFKLLYAQEGDFDFEDEIVASTCVTYKGEIRNEMVKRAFQSATVAP